MLVEWMVAHLSCGSTVTQAASSLERAHEILADLRATEPRDGGDILVIQDPDEQEVVRWVADSFWTLNGPVLGWRIVVIPSPA